MSFEHQLRPAFDNLTARLRRDMERHLDAAVQELLEHTERLAAAAHAQQQQALTTAVDAARAEAEQAAAERHRTALDELHASHSKALADTRSAHQDAIGQLESHHQNRLNDADSRLRQQADEHRAIIEKTAREHEARLGRAVADAEQRMLTSLQAADVAAGARLVEACRAIDRAQSLSDILNVLSEAVAAEAARSAIFLNGQNSMRSWRTCGFDATTIELALDQAGIIALAAQHREAVTSAGDGGDDAGNSAPAFARLSADRAAVAVPMIVSHEVVAIVYADQGQDGDAERASWPAVVEVLARHASRSLEALTAHRLATTLGSGATRRRVVSKPADVVAPPPPPAVVNKPAPVPALDEESAMAQRYARSLIADIRSRHEADVAAGVRERDLMQRLGGPIAQAWALYEAKVPESIRTATNFFHAEMVRTLADGDASLLTPNP